MSGYDNTNRGQIWPNDKKEKDTHPDFKGDVNVDGVEYWVSAWKRKPDANPKAPSLSFALTLKERQQSEPQSGTTHEPNLDDNSDIPF
jgi:hypothetical protein